MRQVETLIIGGGISGLATAWYLNQQGNEVELWESNSRTGGKIATHCNEGFTTEQAASMVLNFRPEVTQFLNKSGLNEHKILRTPTSKRYLIHNGKLQQLPMKMAGMVFSPLWSLSGKLRLFLEPFIFKGGGEHESIADFIRRRLGNEMLDKALGAYISGTLASDPELADSYSVLPHLTALEQRYGSFTAGIFVRKILNRKTASVAEGFSFQGGMTTLVQQLTQQLNDCIHTDYKVTKISVYKKGWIIKAKTASGETSCFAKNLILSTPAPVAAELIKPINHELHQLLADIQYASLSVVHLGFHRKQIKHPVSGTGFLTPFKEKLTLNGSMWIHSLFSQRTPKDHLLLSNYLGGSRHPESIDWSNEKKINVVTEELRHLLGITGNPVWARVDSHVQALPLYHGRYTVRQHAIQRQLASMSGLYCQANYLGGVSIRDRIIRAEQLATTIAHRNGSLYGARAEYG
ncbi:MAG: protoporphyrinogen oxidase [Cocleimonas sp.]|nr:protoporphyrinogen oxidase [Cocleimonas sp.]